MRLRVDTFDVTMGEEADDGWMTFTLATGVKHEGIHKALWSQARVPPNVLGIFHEVRVGGMMTIESDGWLL